MTSKLEKAVIGIVGTALVVGALARVPYTKEHVIEPIKTYISEQVDYVEGIFSLENIFKPENQR